MIILPNPPLQYEPSAESQRNQLIEQADNMNHKRGADVELGREERIIMRSPDGSRWAVSVSNAGALEVTAL